MLTFRRASLVVVLVALFPPRSTLDLHMSSLSAAVQDLASTALGVERMQVTMARKGSYKVFRYSSSHFLPSPCRLLRALTHTYIHTHTRAHARTCTCTHTRTHTHTHPCTRTRTTTQAYCSSLSYNSQYRDALTIATTVSYTSLRHFFFFWLRNV